MNGMPFLHTKSSKINFLPTENYTARSTDDIIKGIYAVTNIYKARGFNIDVYHGDNELNINTLRQHIRPESLNICAQGRQIPIIKISIKTIK